MRILGILLCLTLSVSSLAAQVSSPGLGDGAIRPEVYVASSAALWQGMDSRPTPPTPADTPSPRTTIERDRIAGAAYGAIIGALVGGVGMATATYVLNEDEGRGYWPLGLIVGGTAGGAVGLIVGAIVGAPMDE